MRAASMRKLVSPTSPQCYFNVLGAAHDKSSKISIEIVESSYVIEGRSCSKSRTGCAFRVFKVEPVGTQPIIADVPQPVLSVRFVGDQHPVRAQMCDLLSVGKGWLGKNQSHSETLARL